MDKKITFFMIKNNQYFLCKKLYLLREFNRDCFFSSIGPAKSALTKCIKRSKLFNEADVFEKLISMKVYKVSLDLDNITNESEIVFSAVCSNGMVI